MKTNSYVAAAAFAAALLASPGARAEVSELRMATQFGIGAMPMILIEHNHLLEQQLAAAGLPKVEVKWAQFSGGNPINEGLISGSLDIASAGTTVFVTLWAKAKGNLAVKSAGSLSALPLWFLTRDPKVKSLQDLDDGDKIGVTTVKVSVHAILLQMAAAKIWGPTEASRLDHLTVTLPHADSAIALISGVGEVNNHFSAPPFEYMELKAPNVRRITTAEDILGGPCSYMVAYATEKFRSENPKVFAAYMAALRQSLDYINKDPRGAAKDYLEQSQDKISLDDAVQMITDPGAKFAMAPENVEKLADFMYRQELIKARPESWKDMFFPEVTGLPGS